MPYSTKVTTTKNKRHNWRWVLLVFAGLIISMIGCLLSTQSVGSNITDRQPDNVSVLQWIGFTTGIVTNIFAICAAYLGIRKLLGLIKQRDGKPTIGRILSAVGLCIFAYLIYIVIRGILGAGNHFSLWDYLILISVWAAIWKVIVGKKGNDNNIQVDSSLTTAQKIICVILPISFAIFDLCILVICGLINCREYSDDESNNDDIQQEYRHSPKSIQVVNDSIQKQSKENADSFAVKEIDSFLGIKFGHPIFDYCDEIVVVKTEGKLRYIAATKNYNTFMGFSNYILIELGGIVVGAASMKSNLNEEEADNLFKIINIVFEKKYGKKASPYYETEETGAIFSIGNTRIGFSKTLSTDGKSYFVLITALNRNALREADSNFDQSSIEDAIKKL